MANSNKTVGKTTTLTKADALTKLMIEYNNYQSYRKEHNKRYSFATKDIVAAFAKRLSEEQLDKLTKTYIYQLDMQRLLSDFMYQDYRLNKIYGKEDITFNELSDEERELINKHRARQQEIKEARKEVK